MHTLRTTLHRWHLTVQFSWLAKALLTWTTRPGHNRWMSAGEGLCALGTIAVLLWTLLKGVWWAFGLYPDTPPSLRTGLMVGGALLALLLLLGLMYVTAETFARGVFLTSVGYNDLERHAQADHNDSFDSSLQRQLKSVLALNPTCDMSPLEWWLAQRVWGDAGERALREARLMHALPMPKTSPLAGRQRL